MIRKVERTDYEAIYALYRYFVEESVALFDIHPQSFASFSDRLDTIRRSEPFYVAECEGSLIGYAYTHPAFEKEAYWACKEFTIYMRPGKHHGMAKMLEQRIENDLKQKKIRWLISCITASNQESIAFHERLGFGLLGRLPSCGEKFGQWHGVVWYGKRLDER